MKVVSALILIVAICQVVMALPAASPLPDPTAEASADPSWYYNHHGGDHHHHGGDHVHHHHGHEETEESKYICLYPPTILSLIQMSSKTSIFLQFWKVSPWKNSQRRNLSPWNTTFTISPTHMSITETTTETITDITTTDTGTPMHGDGDAIKVTNLKTQKEIFYIIIFTQFCI